MSAMTLACLILALVGCSTSYNFGGALFLHSGADADDAFWGNIRSNIKVKKLNQENKAFYKKKG